MTITIKEVIEQCAREADECISLRAERDALVQATGASSALEAIGIIRGNKAELDRLTTLRPASEHDTQNEALWWYSPDDFRDASFFRSAPYWTPLPDVKEAK